MLEEILIAGGSGLVGFNVTLRLQQLGASYVSTRFNNENEVYKKSCKQYDFRNFHECLDATKNKSTAILCAGYNQKIGTTSQDLTGAILPGLKITLGLLEAAAKNKVRTVVLMSTATVYQPADFPISEDALDMNTSPYSGYFTVGWTNRYLEQLAVYYSQTYDMRIVIFRPTSIYGPYDSFAEGKSHVVPALIRRAHRKEEPFEIWGEPGVVRDFIYVGDVVSDIMIALANDNIPAGVPMNLCSGSPLTIKEAAETVLKECGHLTKPSFNVSKPTAIKYRAVDDIKYREFFGNSERTAFGDGVKQTVSWYRNNFK